MFKRSSISSPPECHPTGSPWDERTLEFVAISERFAIDITHVERRVVNGNMPKTGPFLRSYEVVANGLLECPHQHVHVTIEFDSQLDSVGVAILTHISEFLYGKDEVNIPLMRVLLRDDKELAREAIVDAHRNAIICNRVTSEFAVWRGSLGSDWVERKNGFPWGARFSLVASASWLRLYHKTAAPWALPTEDVKFSLRQHPEPHMLRRLGKPPDP